MWRPSFSRSSVEPETVVILPEELREEVRGLLQVGRKVDAVRLTRRRTKINLIPAVRAVEALEEPRDA